MVSRRRVCEDCGVHHALVRSEEDFRRGGKTADFQGFLQIGAVSGRQLLAFLAHLAGFSRSVSVAPKKFPKVGGGPHQWSESVRSVPRWIPRMQASTPTCLRPAGLESGNYGLPNEAPCGRQLL